MKVPVSIIVPTKNEESNLVRCLDSVSWADQVIVVDSQSSDRTTEIAETNGAEVVQFYFNGTWPKKKNWILSSNHIRNDWVFILDADEELRPEAEREFAAICAESSPVVKGYLINRRFMFLGRWLKHAYYPNWNLRLFLKDAGRYEKLTERPTDSGDNEVHEHIEVNSEVGKLNCEMLHYAFPTVGVFVEKHNRYSSWEAVVLTDPDSASSDGNLRGSLKRRRKLKRIAEKMPFRPFLRFLYVYIWQRGFLDGREGFIFSCLHGWYQFLIDSKVYEKKKALPHRQ